MSTLIKPLSPVINGNNPLTKGLVMDFPLFERGGNTTQDLVKRRTGAFSGGPTWITNTPGAGINFVKATPTFINLGYNPSTTSTAFTIMALINPILPQVTGFVFYNGDDAGGYGIGVGAAFDGSGSKLFGLFGAVAWLDPGITLTNGVVTQIALSYSGGVATFFVNGEPAGTVSQTPAAPTANSATIGKEIGGATARAYNGDIYYARMWNRLLSNQEIRQLYSNPWQIYLRPSYPVFNQIILNSTAVKLQTMRGWSFPI